MAIFRYQSAAPVRSALVDRLMMVSLRWLQWFQEVGDYIGAQGRQDYAYDPPNLAPGALATVNVTFTGAVFGDMVKACEFYPPAVGGVPTAGVRVFANVVAADTVAVTFFNVTAGAIDLDAGTIRIQVESST